MRKSKEETTLVNVYVDDFLLASNSTGTLETVKKEPGNEYNVKDLGEVETIIGWQITRDLSTQTLKIDQSSFICNLVIEESLRNCNSNIIPMKAGSAIEMIEHDDYEDTKIKPYQHLIGNIIYLACGKRLDIAFIVGFLNRHNANPKKSHLRVAKRVVRYLKGTMQLSLVYGRMSDGKSPTLPPPYGLIGYADSNFAGDPEDQKSVMGNCFFLNGAVVLWSSKKQQRVSTSTTEAEYITLGHAAREAVWVRPFINKMTLDIVPEITLNSVNEMSITLTKNAESQHRTKQIDVQHHYIRELIDEEEPTIAWVSSSEMLADGMTKTLPTETFRRHQAQLRLR